MTTRTVKSPSTEEHATFLDSDLSLDFLRVVERAAVACAHTMGQGDRHGSDQAAVEAMRHEMDSVPIDGTIVIGEGERDEAPMLFIGEKVGMAVKDTGGHHYPEVDIAVDPLEGTNLCATGAPNALAVLAASEQRRAAARARPVHGEADRRPQLHRRRGPGRPGALQPARHRPGTGPPHPGPGRSSSWIGPGTRS